MICHCKCGIKNSVLVLFNENMCVGGCRCSRRRGTFEGNNSIRAPTPPHPLTHSGRASEEGREERGIFFCIYLVFFFLFYFLCFFPFGGGVAVLG